MLISTPFGQRLYAWYIGFGRLRIGVQLVLALLIALPPMWAFIGFEISRMRADAERQTRSEVSNLAHAFVEDVNATVSTIDLSLIGLRDRLQHRTGNLDRLVRRLQQHIGDAVLFQIAVTDARGMLIYSSADAAATAVNVSDREHIRVHMEKHQDKLFISKPLRERVTGQWSVQFTRPLYDSAGKFDGVIVASVAPGHFVRFMDAIQLGGNASLTLVRNDGLILARSPSVDIARTSGLVLADPRFRRAGEAGSGIYRRVSRVDNVERIYAWRTLPRHQLTVLVGQSIATMETRYASQQHAFLLGGAAASLLLAGVGYLLLLASRHRHLATDALADSEARWKFALEGAGDGVWDWDLLRGTVSLSERSRQLLQCDAAELPGSAEAMEQMVHGDDLNAVRTALRKHLEGDAAPYQVEYRASQNDDLPPRWILSRGMVVKRSSSGKPLRMVGTFSDITERKQREALIEHMARHDTLTGLPNRALLHDRLQQALRRARRDGGTLALIYFDLDKFKPVNDTWGHAVGDRLLIAVADRVRGCLRDSDTVARVGGDEFVALLPNISNAGDAATIGANILAALNRPFEVDGLTLHISGSIGIATYPKDAADEDTLMRCADQAMYQAKDAGRGRVQVHRRREESQPA